METFILTWKQCPDGHLVLRFLQDATIGGSWIKGKRRSVSIISEQLYVNLQ